MRRSLSLLFLPFLILGGSQPATGQTPPSRLKIRAILIDKDLNQKPVPRLSIAIQRSDVAGDPVVLRTGFDGLAETQLAPGRYRVSTPEPVEFQGKKYSWDQEITVVRPEETLDLTNDNAKTTGAAPAPGAEGDLAAQFERLQHSVVTVWSTSGRGTGFVVEASGLVLTNQHVVRENDYLAIQFDDKRKFAARLLASDAEKDVAVLRVNLVGATDAVIAPLAEIKSGEAPVKVGERVFTIGNPLRQEKVLTTGVVSKVDEKTIISDVNINPGSSGGPLFNSEGRVVGLTTYGEQARRGPGLSGIVRIEQALPLLEQARMKAAVEAAPGTERLPVDPTDKMPVESLQSIVGPGKLSEELYEFSIGEFDVLLYTPALGFHYDQERERQLAKEREKRAKKSGTTQAKKEEQEPEYRPVLLIRARPKLRVKKSSIFVPGPLKYNFRADFKRMRLLCGGKEVPPIHPQRVETVVDLQGTAAQAKDQTYVGYYRYAHDAVAPSCGQMSLEIYVDAADQPPLVKVLDALTIQRIWADFEPYRRIQAKAVTEKLQ